MSEERTPYTAAPRPGRPLCSFCGDEDALGYTMFHAPDHEDQILLFACGPCGATAFTEVLQMLTAEQKKAWLVVRFPQLYPTPPAEPEKPKRRRKR
jgi:hypothetical protein